MITMRSLLRCSAVALYFLLQISHLWWVNIPVEFHSAFSISEEVFPLDIDMFMLDLYSTVPFTPTANVWMLFRESQAIYTTLSEQKSPNPHIFIPTHPFSVWTALSISDTLLPLSIQGNAKDQCSIVPFRLTKCPVLSQDHRQRHCNIWVKKTSAFSRSFAAHRTHCFTPWISLGTAYNFIHSIHIACWAIRGESRYRYIYAFRLGPQPHEYTLLMTLFADYGAYVHLYGLIVARYVRFFPILDAQSLRFPLPTWCNAYIYARHPHALNVQQAPTVSVLRW